MEEASLRAPVAQCDKVACVTVEGWSAALVEWGLNAFLAADFDGAAQVLHATWSFVQDRAHASATAASRGCRHCVRTRVQQVLMPDGDGVAEGSACWLVGYLRNLCAQAVLAKEQQEGQFVLEGFQSGVGLEGKYR